MVGKGMSGAFFTLCGTQLQETLSSNYSEIINSTISKNPGEPKPSGLELAHSILETRGQNKTNCQDGENGAGGRARKISAFCHVLRKRPLFETGLTRVHRQLLLSRSVVSNSLRPHETQHVRLPCPSLSPGACSNSCPLSQ